MALAASLPGASNASDRSYTSSSASREARLVWLPYRPSASPSGLAADDSPDSSATRAAYNEIDEPSDDDPRQDPFGDGSSRAAGRRGRVNPRALAGPNRVAQLDLPGVPSRRPTSLPPMQLPGGESLREPPRQEGRMPPRSGLDIETLNPPSRNADAAPPIPGVEQGRPVPNIDDQLANPPQRSLTIECPPSGQFSSINEINVNVPPKPGMLPDECPMKHEDYLPREWPITTYAWKASGLCHKPLYFEDVQLERYGHSWGPYLQPVISHAHFFVTVPILPYLMGVNPPNECMYTLGYYRPGSCAPYVIDPLPISVRGAFWEAGAWTGAVFLVP